MRDCSVNVVCMVCQCYVGARWIWCECEVDACIC